MSRAPASDSPPSARARALGPADVAVPWRSVGPANPSGRITDIDVPRGRPWERYVATAGGGLWKTSNAGTTWTSLFDHYPTASIGDVAVAPSNPDIVWVGTGEENPRNSVQWGDGVYKSTDGGATFRHMGLSSSFQIGHIAIHPRDPDIVYVAALGRLWGSNRERGVFATRDGGATWDHALYLDAHTGCIDVRIDPSSPSVVYAAMYDRWRDELDGNDPARRFGPAAGIYRSDDDGNTWKRLTRGLPTCQWGRSGLALWDRNPSTLFAIVETERSGWASGDSRIEPAADAAATDAQPEPGAAASQPPGGDAEPPAGLAAGQRALGEPEPVPTTGAGAEPAPGGAESAPDASAPRAAPASDPPAALTGEGAARSTPERGRRGPFSGRLQGQLPNVQDQQGSRGYETGGVFRSDDRGETWRRVNSLTERPFYFSVLAVDPTDAARLYACGVRLYASRDGGAELAPIDRGIHVDFHALWIDPDDPDHLLVGSDGGLDETWDGGRTYQVFDNLPVGQLYHVDVDSSVPYRIWGGLQDNGTWGGPSRTRAVEGISTADWVKVYGGDGFTVRVDRTDPSTLYATSQGGGLVRIDTASGAVRRVHRPRSGFRFNWDTPFFLSPHNPHVLYFAGDHVFRSLDRGEHSQQLTERPLGRTARGTAVALAESPVRSGLLYAGTDDGALWRSPDHGHTWVELRSHLRWLAGPRHVSSIQPSALVERRVYLTMDGHRSDDFRAYALVSEDAGDTWAPLADDLPDEPCHVLREDPRNPDLLYLGTEFGCWVSLDRGGSWLPLGRGLPTVAVRDLVVQDREGELVAATHGRGVWIADIAPLRQLDAEALAEPSLLLAPQPATLWREERRHLTGDRIWRAPNPPRGAVLYAWFAAAPPAPPALTIRDITGAAVGELAGRAVAGLQQLVWDARLRRAGADPTAPGTPRDRDRGGRGRGRASVAPPGAYSVEMRVGSTALRQPLLLLPDPAASVPAPAAQQVPR